MWFYFKVLISLVLLLLVLHVAAMFFLSLFLLLLLSAKKNTCGSATVGIATEIGYEQMPSIQTKCDGKKKCVHTAGTCIGISLMLCILIAKQYTGGVNLISPHTYELSHTISQFHFYLLFFFLFFSFLNILK